MTLNQHPVYKKDRLQRNFEAFLPAMSVMAVGGIIVGAIFTFYYLFFQFNSPNALIFYVFLLIIGIMVLILMEYITTSIENGLSSR